MPISFARLGAPELPSGYRSIMHLSSWWSFSGASFWGWLSPSPSVGIDGGWISSRFDRISMKFNGFYMNCSLFSGIISLITYDCRLTPTIRRNCKGGCKMRPGPMAKAEGRLPKWESSRWSKSAGWRPLEDKPRIGPPRFPTCPL